MDLYNKGLQYRICNKKYIKIITGLSNFNLKDIIKKVKAAELGGATYVDIAAHPDIVRKVKSLTNLPICVSSIDPVKLYECSLAGAHIIEIGNFDIFYNKNIVFSENQILALAKETKLLLNKAIICVTIPHTLLLGQQIRLANKLQEMGINMIQTEGISTKNKVLSNYKSEIYNSIYKASSALSISYALAEHLDIPIIASSGLNALSAPIAISYGASGIGLGSVLNNFTTINDMANYIYEISSSLSHFNINSMLNLNKHQFFPIYYSI